MGGAQDAEKLSKQYNERMKLMDKKNLQDTLLGKKLKAK